MGLCTETLERVSPPVHISNLSYGHAPPLEVCARGGADFNGQFFFMRRYVSEIDFRKLPELRGHVPHASWPRPRRTQRVAHTRRARWGGARGSVWAGPYRATAPLAAATAHGVGDRGTQQSDCPKRPKTRGRRPARVGHGLDAPNEWRTRVVRVGGARGGPCGQVHIARRSPWCRLRLTGGRPWDVAIRLPETAIS